MDRVIIGDDFHSLIVATLAETRRPFVLIEHEALELANVRHQPRIMTPGGIVFGLPAIIDYLLHRMTEPPMLSLDFRRRALQTTVFWALVDREFELLTLKYTDAEVYKWLCDVADQVRCNPFYTGDQFNLCDIGLYSIVEFLHRCGVQQPQAVSSYAMRCRAELKALVERNSEVLNDTDD